jgi:YbgC/YbaW family acyl-CoA thioester hydrolase
MPYNKIVSSIELIVKSEGIDKYNHLNNARYPLYFEEGRVDLIVNAKKLNEYIEEEGLHLLVKKLECNFEKQVCREDKIEIVSEFSPYEGGATIVISQKMLKEGEIVATSEIPHFLYNPKTKNPTRMPKNIAHLLIDED